MKSLSYVFLYSHAAILAGVTECSVGGCAFVDEDGSVYVDGAFVTNSAWNYVATFTIADNWQTMAISSTNTVGGKYIMASVQPDTFTNRYSITIPFTGIEIRF